MRILVIGSGGREHALGWKISQSSQVKKIFFAPGNAGTKTVGENIDIAVDRIDELLTFAKREKIDLTVVGPEMPLVKGVVDLFRKNKMMIVGPTKKASRIEGSKIFAKRLMKKYGIPTADFEVFSDFKKAEKYLKVARYPVVVKADGLAAGKGVAVCSNFAQARAFLGNLMVDKIFGPSGKNIIVEECLTGQEVSIMVLTDGVDFICFPSSQDHKRLKDGDRGPNTGGMGAYTPTPFTDKKIMKVIEEEIVRKTLYALKKEGTPYTGILYPGLILTSSGPKVLEYNCRFGDPETQPLMMLLKSDIVPILIATTNGGINRQRLIFKKGASVSVMLVSKGYPGKYGKGEVINGLDKFKNNDIQLFHSGTIIESGKVVTHGGRVIGVTTYAPSIRQAVKSAYRVIGKKGINFKDMQYRGDIASRAIKKNK